MFKVLWVKKESEVLNDVLQSLWHTSAVSAMQACLSSAMLLKQ